MAKDARPKPLKDERPQAQRFKETARQLGADETGKLFEEAFQKIVAEQKKLPNRQGR